MIRPRTFGETVAGTLLTMSATAKPSTNLWETPFLDGCFSEDERLLRPRGNEHDSPPSRSRQRT